MKVLRFLLVMAFVLTVFVSPARAQTEVYGYIPLVTEADSSVPLEVRAHEAFNRLQPRFLEAQQKGEILQFKPEFFAGIVKVQLAGELRESTISGMRVFSSVQEALALVPRETLKAVNESYNPKFHVYIANSCVSMEGLMSDDRIIGSLRDNTGKILSTADTVADLYGYAWGCFNGVYGSLLPGYKANFKVYTSAGALRGSYAMTVPLVSFTALNKEYSLASGRGPIGRTYTAHWHHPKLDAYATYIHVEKTGTISSAGTWNEFFGTPTFRGGDWLSLTVNYNRYFTVGQSMDVPYIFCELGGSYCGMAGFPNQSTSMSISHASGLYRFTGKFNFWGWFNVNLTDASGYPVFLTAGDVINGSGFTPYVLPNLTAAVNFDTNFISGKAPANRYFSVSFSTRSLSKAGTEGGGAWVKSDASGNYSIDFSPIFDLTPTNLRAIYIYYIDPITGHETDSELPFAP